MLLKFCFSRPTDKNSNGNKLEKAVFSKAQDPEYLSLLQADALMFQCFMFMLI